MNIKIELALGFFIFINSVTLLFYFLSGFSSEMLIRVIAGNVIPLGILLMPNLDKEEDKK